MWEEGHQHLHVASVFWYAVTKVYPGSYGVHVIDRVVSREYAGLAWINYDILFCNHAALNKES